MRKGGAIIKSAMSDRGFKHRRSEDAFSIRGEYARNLQFVYSREKATKAGLIVDLVYFAADLLHEKLVIGLYRENADAENGVYINSTRSVDLKEFNAVELNSALEQLIVPIKDKLK